MWAAFTPRVNESMRDEFSAYHPLVNFLYFALVLAYSMFFMHPVCLIISFVCAFAYSVYLKGKKAWKIGLCVMLPMLIGTALLNPAFNHQGNTILLYLRDGNPLTLESIIYGIAAALMLICVMSWFTCFNAVISSDKFVYIFGRAIPSLSLVLSMALRFIPRFRAQIKLVSDARRCVGRNISSGNILNRAGEGLRILSCMMTWVLENTIEISDSMKSRGYGLPGRTAFSIYRFGKRDRHALIYTLICGAYIAAGALSGGLYFRYFPTIKGVLYEPYALSLYVVYAALCIMPVVINAREAIRWNILQSKIRPLHIRAGKNPRWTVSICA